MYILKETEDLNKEGEDRKNGSIPSSIDYEQENKTGDEDEVEVDGDESKKDMPATFKSAVEDPFDSGDEVSNHSSRPSHDSRLVKPLQTHEA